MTRYLTLEDLLALALDLGVGPVRDLGLLSAAAQRPATSLYGRDAYDTLNAKAGALLESIVSNHALVDGNKRLGWLALAVFFDINDVDLDVDEFVAEAVVMDVASGSLRMPEPIARIEHLRANS
ncbi:type II toxin-antitoxin system death-on-curing family toxin [Demequina sp.]|uniref:type II toxin-antitoxin system death-on-curing family toxin n=1 Tax=Demequina sp. TaxID=2050685 RepID=UPI003A85A98E